MKTYIEGIYGFTGETDPATAAALIKLVVEESAEKIQQNPVGTMFVTLDSTPAMPFIITANDGSSVTVGSIAVT